MRKPLLMGIATLLVSYFFAYSMAQASMARRSIEDIDQALSAQSSGPMPAQTITTLEDARKSAEEVSNRLKSEIENLKLEKQQLETSQKILGSGLVGALVAAIVAIIGALSNFKRSRADRDLRRLEVLEKAHELTAKGIDLPNDIRTEYGVYSVDRYYPDTGAQLGDGNPPQTGQP